MDSDSLTKHRDFHLEHEIHLVVLRLIQLRDTNKYGIKSVKSGNTELKSFDRNACTDLRSLSRESATAICKQVGYVPAKRGDKCDIIINDQRTGIRCLNFTDRALVNHSTRPKYEKVCEYAGLDISILDSIIDKYIERRKLGVFNEDCFYHSEANPFIPHKAFLKGLLTCFAFNSFDFNKDSKNPEFISDHIDAILDFIDPVEESLWRTYTADNYFESIWTSLCFSLRDKKGMPDDSKLFLPENASILRWNYPFKDSKGYVRNKAALHIRVKRYDAQKFGEPFEVKYREAITCVRQNQGERDEYLLKLFLIECRQKSIPVPIGSDVQVVRSVGSKTVEYGNLSYKMDWETLQAEELISVCASVKATKAGMYDKADVFVNGIGISVKSERGGNPSLINHTTRDKILRVMNAIHHPIIQLDKMVDQYWNLRLSARIKEDISTLDRLCPFGNVYEPESISEIKPLLDYFAFDGTGTRDSSAPATYILSIASPTDVSTWTYYTKEDFIKSVWSRLVFSIRSKTTPQFIDESREDHRTMLPWIRECDFSLKGALSVRISSSKKNPNSK